MDPDVVLSGGSLINTQPFYKMIQGTSGRGEGTPADTPERKYGEPRSLWVQHIIIPVQTMHSVFESRLYVRQASSGLSTAQFYPLGLLHPTIARENRHKSDKSKRGGGYGENSELEEWPTFPVYILTFMPTHQSPFHTTSLSISLLISQILKKCPPRFLSRQGHFFKFTVLSEKLFKPRDNSF